MKSIGSKIRTLRNKKKLSQKEFGKIFDLAESTIGMYERDERKPDYETLGKFADYFEVTTDYLLGRKSTTEFTPQKIFSHKLENARRDKKLTANDIASRIDIPVETYKKYEQALLFPEAYILDKITTILDVSEDYLFDRDTGSITTKVEQDEADFQAFANDPTLQKWYKELPKSKEEDLQKLRTIWEMIKNDVIK